MFVESRPGKGPLPKPLDSHQLCCLIQLGLHIPIHLFSPLPKPRWFHCTTLPWRGHKHTTAGPTPVKPEYVGYKTAAKSTVRLGILIQTGITWKLTHLGSSLQEPTPWNGNQINIAFPVISHYSLNEQFKCQVHFLTQFVLC